MVKPPLSFASTTPPERFWKHSSASPIVPSPVIVALLHKYSSLAALPIRLPVLSLSVTAPPTTCAPQPSILTVAAPLEIADVERARRGIVEPDIEIQRRAVLNLERAGVFHVVLRFECIGRACLGDDLAAGGHGNDPPTGQRAVVEHDRAARAGHLDVAAALRDVVFKRERAHAGEKIAILIDVDALLVSGSLRADDRQPAGGGRFDRSVIVDCLRAGIDGQGRARGARAVDRSIVLQRQVGRAVQRPDQARTRDRVVHVSEPRCAVARIGRGACDDAIGAEIDGSAAAQRQA